MAKTSTIRDIGSAKLDESFSILDRVKAGLPLDDIFVVDVHAHIGHIAAQHRPQRDTPSIKRALNRAGINRCCISSILSLYGGDISEGNCRTSETVAAYPDLFMGYVVLDPRDLRGVESEFKKWFHEKNELMSGFKLYPPIHKYPLNHENYCHIYSLANKLKLPMLIHTWEDDHDGRWANPALLYKIVADYPNAKFILGHSGGTLSGFRAAIEVAKDQPNVYLELCASRASLGQIEFFVDKVGSEQILFGSDIQFFDVFSQLSKVAYAKISDEQKLNILGLNAARVFGLNPSSD